MFSWYKYLIVSLLFSHLGFLSGNLFLIAPFPVLCLLVPFSNHKSQEGVFSVVCGAMNLKFLTEYQEQVTVNMGKKQTHIANVINSLETLVNGRVNTRHFFFIRIRLVRIN